MRRYLIAGNWKMNMTAAEAVELISGIKDACGQEQSVDFAVCPPFTAIDAASDAIDNSQIKLGAQNLYPEANGAFTGEIAPGMLTQLGCAYVILGHSERREYFKETDAFINKKVKVALENALTPILCVGETLEEREAEKTLSVVETQIKGGLEGISADMADRLVIAYEPVWAIGTGKTATPEMAQEVHALIRKLLVELFGEAQAAEIPVLYGGSMKPGNASELMDQPDIDGGLIGGASLKADSFADLIKIAASKA